MRRLLNFDGCRNHTNEGCDLYRMSELRSILLKIDFTIAAYADSMMADRNWGFPKHSLTERDFIKLYSYRDAIHNHYESMRLNFHPCLSAEELRLIVEKSTRLTNLVPCVEKLDNQEVDRTNFDFNSKCAPYEAWEKALVLKMPEFEISVTKNECLRFAYDVSVTVDKDRACQLFYDVSVEREKACDFNYSVSVDHKECKLQYDLCVENQGCELSYDVYADLVKCGLSYDLIAEMTECGISAKYDEETGEIYFTTLQGNEYDLTDLDNLQNIKI